MTNPKISIITPSFNDAQFLETTIQSVLSQNYPNLEYIIIDGGSTDGSIEIIEKYNDQLTFWTSENDEGMYHALQKGFEKSTGQIMGWINSDDIMHPGSLFTIGQIFNDFKHINWLQGIPNIIDETNRIICVSPNYESDKLYFYQKRHIESYNYIQQESTYWRRSLWEKSGGYISTTYKFAGDFDLWIRFFQVDKLFNVYALLGSFRASKSGQASVEYYPEYAEETVRILEAYPLNNLERRQLLIWTFLQKTHNKINSYKLRLLTKFKLNRNTVVNHKISFNSKLQRFESL